MHNVDRLHAASSIENSMASSGEHDNAAFGPECWGQQGTKHCVLSRLHGAAWLSAACRLHSPQRELQELMQPEMSSCSSSCQWMPRLTLLCTSARSLLL